MFFLALCLRVWNLCLLTALQKQTESESPLCQIRVFVHSHRESKPRPPERQAHTLATRPHTYFIRGKTYSTHFGVGAHQHQGKKREKKRKGIEVQRAQPPTPSRVIDALIGDEEQNKDKQIEGKRNRRIRKCMMKIK